MSSNLEAFSNAAYIDVISSPISFTNNQYNHGASPTEVNMLVDLSQHCAFGAFLNSVERADPPRCSPRTRVRLTGEMKGWATGRAQVSSAMWLTGSAGSGKTALSQTTAEELRQEGLIIGCHFFYRSSEDGKRSDGHRWAPNMVHQMIRIIPETLPFVEMEIKGNNSVFDQQPDGVFEDLFLVPLIKAFNTPVQRFSFWGALKRFFRIARPTKTQIDIPRLVVLDGLDECKSPEMQVLILRTIANAIPRLPIPLRFLIASRPETHIRTAIDRLFNNVPLHRINLDEDQDIREDLQEYYSNRFRQIRREHPSLRGQGVYADWPSQDDVNILINKSSTQFIFASTAMNYISHPRNHPVKRLEVILGKLATPQDDRPFDALDTLYTVILLGVEKADRTMVRLILTFIYLAGKGEFPKLKLEASPEFLDGFLGLHPGDVSRLLDPLVSLLTLPEAPSGMISMLHASFFDYFCDPDRSKELVMELGDAHEVIAAKHRKYILRWCDGGVSKPTKANTFLYHASHATPSQRFIRSLYGLYDDMICFYFNSLSSPTHRFAELQDTYRNYLSQIHDLLLAKLGRERDTFMIDPSDTALPSTLKVHRNKMAAIVIQHACHSTRKEDLTDLYEEICFATSKGRSGHTSIWGKLSVQSCIPLIRQLVKTKIHGKVHVRTELLSVLESPKRLRPWAAELAQDVLVYLDEVVLVD